MSRSGLWSVFVTRASPTEFEHQPHHEPPLRCVADPRTMTTYWGFREGTRPRRRNAIGPDLYERCLPLCRIGEADQRTIPRLESGARKAGARRPRPRRPHTRGSCFVPRSCLWVTRGSPAPRRRSGCARLSLDVCLCLGKRLRKHLRVGLGLGVDVGQRLRHRVCTNLGHGERLLSASG